MKLLRITADGLPLFREKVELTFYARQRVSEDDRNALHKLFSNVYINPVNGLIGINASGKTSVLKLVLLVLDILNHEPINHLDTKGILGFDGKVCLNIWFYSENSNDICRLETCIETQKVLSGEVRYVIRDERLWTKVASTVSTRKICLILMDCNLLQYAIRTRNTCQMMSV